MKVKDKTKIFTRTCLAIILVAIAFLIYKLHFKGSDVDFISSINPNYSVTVEKQLSVIDNSEYKRLNLGEEYTTYKFKGKDAVIFKEAFSSLKIRKLLRINVKTKHVEDFVWYRITITDENGNEYRITTSGDYIIGMEDYTIFFCKPYGNWRDTLETALSQAEIIDYRFEKNLNLN